MKRTLAVFLVLLVFSCANTDRKEKVVIMDDSDLVTFEIKTEKRTLEGLASEKLGEYFELLQLLNEHPEFEKAILLQLKELSVDEPFQLNGPADFSIENIRTEETLVTLTDSLQKLKIYYDITTGDSIKTDSINALITIKTLLLDSVKTTSTKIRFAVIY